MCTRHLRGDAVVGLFVTCVPVCRNNSNLNILFCAQLLLLFYSVHNYYCCACVWQVSSRSILIYLCAYYCCKEKCWAVLFLVHFLIAHKKEEKKNIYEVVCLFTYIWTVHGLLCGSSSCVTGFDNCWCCVPQVNKLLLGPYVCIVCCSLSTLSNYMTCNM